MQQLVLYALIYDLSLDLYQIFLINTQVVMYYTLLGYLKPNGTFIEHGELVHFKCLLPAELSKLFAAFYNWWNVQQQFCKVSQQLMLVIQYTQQMPLHISHPIFFSLHGFFKDSAF